MNKEEEKEEDGSLRTLVFMYRNNSPSQSDPDVLPNRRAYQGTSTFSAGEASGERG